VPEVDLETMLLVAGQGAPSFTGIDVGDLPIDPLEFVREAALILTRRLRTKPTSVSAMDVAMGLAGGLPSDRYAGAGIERYLRDGLSERELSAGLGELPDEP
jgi:hypothetical protein